MRLFALQVNKSGALSLDGRRGAPRVFHNREEAKMEQRYLRGEIVCVSLTLKKVDDSSRPVWVIIFRPLTSDSVPNYIDTCSGGPILFGTRHRAMAEASVFDGEIAEKRYLTVLGKTVSTPARLQNRCIWMR